MNLGLIVNRFEFQRVFRQARFGAAPAGFETQRTRKNLDQAPPPWLTMNPLGARPEDEGVPAILAR
jgi:hypothetical protein